MQLNSLVHGFRINRIRQTDEISAVMYEMIHEKTNARAIWLKRDDENKTFAIGFKTTPVDDTGVFHILEHSVLNGSKRYPVREPFVDLLKGSLQTFLNAMTYPDKTVYPVSSRNDKDFVNLMRVYLDAVFNPLALENPNIFYQEGWHYELFDADEQPSFKGVVFNEMKGAFSSPDEVRERYLRHALFPDTCYGSESGGDPEYITDLTYEQFCSSHRKYYNPSNAYIFLDGDMDIESILKIIDEEYMSNYTSAGDKIEIEVQEAIKAPTVVKEIEVSPETTGEGKAQIAYGYVIGKYSDMERTLAFDLISSVLCSTNESPLKKLILNNNLGEDISFDVQDGIFQPFIEISVINTDIAKEEKITELLKDELERIVREGLDRKELEASLNQREFKARERDFHGAPKGLVFALTSFDSWLYGGDPLDAIVYDKLFDSLRQKLATNYYEELIEEFILNSDHCAKVLLRPSNTLGHEKAVREKAKIEAAAQAWSTEEKNALVEMNQKLVQWQASEDTAEQKATLPSLRIDDLKTTATRHEVEVCLHDSANTVLKHNENTAGISYVTIYSAADDLELEDYSVLAQLLILLGKLPTKKYDSLTLNRLIKSIIGDFTTQFSVPMTYKDHKIKHLAAIQWSSLHRNDLEAVELVKEILYNTDFSDKQAIRDIIKQNLIMLEQTIIRSGNAIAIQRAAAYSSPTAAVTEYASGYEAYKWLKGLDDNWDDKADAFIDKLTELSQKIFIKERYTVSVAGDDKTSIVKAVLDDAPHGEAGAPVIKNPLGHRREGIVIPSNVSYAAKSSVLLNDIEKLGTAYVISNILTYDYLWLNIRVKGGAYGCGFRCPLSKIASFHSFRDPNPAGSLEVFRNSAAYLREFCERNEAVENYIVGTTGDFDPLLTTKNAIRMADFEYIMEYSYDDKNEILQQILNTGIDDICRTVSLLEKINEEDNVCVIGNKDALEACRSQLDDIFDYNQKQE